MDQRASPPRPVRPTTARILQAALDFDLGRTPVLSRLYGRAVRADPVRDEITRRLVLAHYAGEQKTLASLARVMRPRVAATTVRETLAEIEAAGLLIFERREDDRRVTVIHPTQKLIDFYDLEMPLLVSDIQALAASF